MPVFEMYFCLTFLSMFVVFVGGQQPALYSLCAFRYGTTYFMTCKEFGQKVCHTVHFSSGVAFAQIGVLEVMSNTNDQCFTRI